eukprot:GHVU01070503.1.p1 GENE.GHVU01070503.1~~GHVU01070503.1.p1  ORF type:complete len:105 (+),score=7.21 GHVU01070503.1:209-523(+)
MKIIMMYIIIIMMIYIIIIDNLLDQGHPTSPTCPSLPMMLRDKEQKRRVSRSLVHPKIPSQGASLSLYKRQKRGAAATVMQGMPGKRPGAYAAARTTNYKIRVE